MSSTNAEHATAAQAGAIINVPPETMRRWRASRQGPPYRRFGRLIRYHVPALLAWAQQQEQ